MPLLLPEVQEAIKEKDFESLRTLLEVLHPADIVEILQRLDQKLKIRLFNSLDTEFLCAIFEEMSPEEAMLEIKILPTQKAVNILNNLSPDKRADIFLKFSDKEKNKFLSIMEPQEAENVKKLIKYSPETAAGIMTPNFIGVQEEITVGEVVEYIKKAKFNFTKIYVLKNKTPIGAVYLRDIIISDKKTPIKNIMKKIITIDAYTDQEEVAYIFSKYNLDSAPVVNEKKEIQGIITYDNIFDVIRKESYEDMRKFGATTLLEKRYFSSSILRIAKTRFPWLCILLLINFVSGFVIENFSYALQSMITLAIFIPVLLDCGGNSGSQAATVIIRGLAIGEIHLIDVWRVIRREFLIGILTGIGLGVLVGIRALLVKDSFLLLGVAVGLSMIIVIIVATVIGAALPIIFQKLKIDPALVSSPLITTIMDITSLIVYFTIAVKILNL